MQSRFEFTGPTAKTEFEIEKTVLETLRAMEGYKKITPSAITNTALKYFISRHSDFLPPRAKSKPVAVAKK